MPLFILPHEGICSMLTIRVEEAIELIPNVCSPWCGKGGMTSNRLLDPSGKDISKNFDKILLNIQQEKEGTHTSSTAVGTVGSLGSSVSSAPGKWAVCALKHVADQVLHYLNPRFVPTCILNIPKLVSRVQNWTHK